MQWLRVREESLTPGQIETGAPSGGQDNPEIYQGLVGLSEGEILRLKEERIIERMTEELETVKQFRALFMNRYPGAREIKAQGQRIVGWICIYVPEEILHAAGLLPFRLIGGSSETPRADAYLRSNNGAQEQQIVGRIYTPEEIVHAAGLLPFQGIGGSSRTSRADAYLRSNHCSFARNCLEQGLNGNLDFLDGIVACNTCDHIRRLYDVWMKYLPTPFKKILGIPCKVSKVTLSYFEDEFALFQRDLEEHFGVTITPEALSQSIRLYNRSRELLERLYELRKADPPPITGAEVMEVIRAGWVVPREQYNPLLEALLEEVTPKADRLAGSNPHRLLIYGSELDEPGYFQVIEDLGGLVVVDDLCTGSRYFAHLVEEQGSPLEALAVRYLTRPFCARMRPTSERVRRLQKLAQEFRVEGVIHQTLKFCDLHAGNSPITKAGLDELGLPSLWLEREYVMAGVGQMKTRVEAFLESLEGRRGR